MHEERSPLSQLPLCTSMGTATACLAGTELCWLSVAWAQKASGACLSGLHTSAGPGLYLDMSWRPGSSRQCARLGARLGTGRLAKKAP